MFLSLLPLQVALAARVCLGPELVMFVDEDEEQREEVAGVRQTHMSFEWSDGTGESDFNQLLGKRVRIIGLTGRPELNGCLGACTFIYTLLVHSCVCIVSYDRPSVHFMCPHPAWYAELTMYSWHGGRARASYTKATIPPHTKCRPSV